MEHKLLRWNSIINSFGMHKLHRRRRGKRVRVKRCTTRVISATRDDGDINSPVDSIMVRRCISDAFEPESGYPLEHISKRNLRNVLRNSMTSTTKV